jgi:hypothetical protein
MEERMKERKKNLCPTPSKGKAQLELIYTLRRSAPKRDFCHRVLELGEAVYNLLHGRTSVDQLEKISLIIDNLHKSRRA